MTDDACRALWPLEPGLAFLNHGSFGACPFEVLEAQTRLRLQMEREPVRFFVRELEPLLEAARARVATFLGARAEDLVFVRNATEGVNAVLRSRRWDVGDAILVTDHGYHAVSNAADYVAEREGLRVDVACVPFPIASPETVVEAMVAALTPETRLVIVDAVTSPTGLVFPVEAIVRAMHSRGVEVLVDAAHAPGMVPLALDALGADYVTGNFHKWVCAPKGAAFLHVRADRQATVVPPVISHGLDSRRARSRYLETFDWVGTGDPTPWLCVPTALDFVDTHFGGWDVLRQKNRALVLEARDLLCEALGTEAPAPASMIGSLAAVPLPPGGEAPTSSLYVDPLQRWLLDERGIEVPIVPWPAPPSRLVRVSAMAYSTRGEYERLAAALLERLR
ncbi:MAG: aminotransferase class V-fold PLP-dependent enzyme [Sandaracinus sp.]|nr:aminotransferase class V-fold PLP-dependent enzyme [Sandaracinus sp.]MCB9615098.1 aminotransferase class V-fold PLP-dependent enzyme [Sandaracinus sp.]MCB9634978.1 aminotransferase class V-fold PLP-dependent enzyme [Sandaracinus sp.]